MHRSIVYQFEWDPIKARTNLQKHGITFERSTAVFKDPNALSRFDNEHSLDEDRWITLGLDQNGMLLVLCHTFRIVSGNGAVMRIISARKATKKEMKQYEEL